MPEYDPGLIEKWRIEFEADARKLLSDLKEMAGVSAAWEKSMTRADTVAQGVMKTVNSGVDMAYRGYNRVRDAVEQVGIAWERGKRPLIDYDGIVDTVTRKWIRAIEEFAQGAGQSFETMAMALHEAGWATLETPQQLAYALQIYKENVQPGPTTQLTGAITSLGGTVGTVILGLIGVQAVKSLQQFAEALRKAAEVAGEYQFSLFQLNAAVRAMQRVHGDSVSSVDEWSNAVTRLREEFGIFSTTEIREAISNALLFTRELGFTEDQINDLIYASAVLAEMNGRTMPDAVRSIIVGMTGYRVSLRRLKIHIDDSLVAQEALRQGITKNINEMTQEEKAGLTLSVMMRQVAAMSEDAAKAQDTLQGRVQTAKAEIQDATAVIGRAPAAAKAALTELWADIVTFFAKVIDYAMVAELMFKRLVTVIMGVAGGVAEAIAELLMGEIALEDFGRVVEEKVNRAIYEANLAMYDTASTLGMIPPLAEDAAQNLDLLAESIDELNQKFEETTLDLILEMEKALEDYAERRAEIVEDSLEQMYRLEEDYQIRLARLWEDYQRKLEETVATAAATQANLEEDLSDKLADIAADLEEKRREASEEYRKKELRAEEDFQIKMRRMYARYQENLLDALLSRDARQILVIQRNYRRQRAEAIEDYEVDKRRRREDYEDRLADFDKWAEEQRKKALEAMQDRLEDLEENLEERREKLLQDYKRQVDDANRSYNRQREDAKKSYRRRLQDLRDNLDRTLRTMGEGLAQQEYMTRAGGLRVWLALRSFFGPSGYIDTLMEGFKDRMDKEIRIRVKVFDTGTSGGIADIIPGSPGTSDWADFIQEQYEDVQKVAPTQTEPLTTAQRLDISITADEHFSPQFEDELYEHLVRAISPLVRTVGRVEGS